MNQRRRTQEDRKVSGKLGNQRCEWADAEPPGDCRREWEQAKGPIEPPSPHWKLTAMATRHHRATNSRPRLTRALKAIENEMKRLHVRPSQKPATSLTVTLQPCGQTTLPRRGDQSVVRRYEDKRSSTRVRHGLSWRRKCSPRLLEVHNLTSFTNHERLDVMMARPGGRHHR